jgi:hypothetical protein
MMLLYLLFLFVVPTFNNHLYWFEKDRPELNKNNDKSWSYCDMKCLYLETFEKGKDFVVITFAEKWK